MHDLPSVAAHWPGGFDEAGLRAWAENLRERLGEQKPSLGLVFITPPLFPHAAQILEILRVHAQIPLLAGCSSGSLIAGAAELEDDSGLVLALYALPGAQLKAFHFTQQDIDEAGEASFWPSCSGVGPAATNGWLIFADPFRLNAESWLESWEKSYPTLPALGGLASGDFTAQMTQVYLNGNVYEQGGVAISVGGAVKLVGVISQGCTPIGDTWTLTRVEGHYIQQIGNRPAYEVLLETFGRLSPEEQQRSRGTLFLGLVINEYLEDFHRGDFLVRNILGADPQAGVIAVGARPRMGQTVQFQRRDAAAAEEDMRDLLDRARRELAGATILGGCLCSCNGRGRNLFGTPSHDAQMVREFLGPMGLAGFFCNGEIGPIGRRNFLHGYTASLALFVKQD